jgi:hypothetical protein
VLNRALRCACASSQTPPPAPQRRWVDALKWSRSEEWADADDADWLVGGEVAGEATAAGPLTFLSVKDAGHMVPMDKPRAAYEMIYAFTRGEALAPARRKGDARGAAKGAAAAALAPRRAGAFATAQ